MKEYEFINFSDPYTFTAENFETAALVVIIMGPAYGAKTAPSVEPEEQVPVFLFGSPDEWYLETFHRSPKDGLSALHNQVADAFESFMLGSFEDRKRYNAALKAIDDQNKREKFIEEWQDSHSSLNDIGTRAHDIAKALKEAKPREPGT